MTKAENMDSVTEHTEDLLPGLTAMRAVPRWSDDWFKKLESVEASLTSQSRLVMQSDPYSMGADRFRSLRMHLCGLANAMRLKVLMVTSARAGEGKSVTALNLAASLAEQKGRVVILIEADLRCSTLSGRLGLKPWPGLAQCLERATDPLMQIRQVQPLGFYFLPAGEPTPNPMQLLNSDGFSKMLQRLRSVADWVIVDCPPMSRFPDALAIRGNTDGCLWVVRANVTSREVAREEIDLFGKERIVGMVLNGAEPDDASYSNYSNQVGSQGEPWTRGSVPVKLMTRRQGMARPSTA